ncbi:reverse transcriptase [Fusarium mundagurra]|uniref:Reverse transcriptase n=1 Tax=Fusarium mundagurra TaxID=1567541 RepID=A0A8H6DNS9_9HYPO|nr:reverse transcriptase [Fusarium mundagurra]
MPELLEEAPRPLFGFAEDYFSDNIADEDTSARDSAKYWKNQQKRATAAKKAVKKEKMKAMEEERRTKRLLRKSFRRDCKQFRKKERQGRQEATVPPLEEIDTERFAGSTVLLKSRCQATDAWQDKSLDVLTLWTDGSINTFDGGAAVVFMDKSLGWEKAIPKEIGWQVKGHHGRTGDVELMAIAGALEAAISIVSQQSNSHLRRVAIFSDSGAEAIPRCSEIRHFPIPPLDSLVRRRSHELVRLGVALSLIWVPGHSGIEGNHRAHNIAHRMAKLDRQDLCQGIVSIPRSMDDIVDFGFHHESVTPAKVNAWRWFIGIITGALGALGNGWMGKRKLDYAYGYVVSP